MLDQARLYAITPDADPEQVVDLVGALLRGGVQMVQLRHKSLARAQLLQLATRLVELVRGAGGLLIVNDHVDIAMISGADGVHLGADDLPVGDARRVVGRNLIIGASASTAESAMLAMKAGADYLGAGPVFATPLKAAKPAIGPEGVRSVADQVPVPVFAIGGIDTGNVGMLVSAGVVRVCVIRALAEAADPEATARRFREILGE
ncbi:MAG: thiamine phosphate synthase [Candidatus Dormibacteraeota bacterium]|nr:thiamine phosphate synthase [Candidatus Dormibacteraeota bacterium]